MIDLIENLSAHKHIGVFDFLKLIRSLVAGWEQKNIFSWEQVLKIIGKVGSLLLFMEYEKMVLMLFTIDRRCDNCIQAPCAAFQMNFSALIWLDIFCQAGDNGVFLIDFY